ncbi:MAG: L-lactate permease, partial [Anaerolineaceae bacterium]|nr:L-lactate permease [Anaerolineaceae bacterium]
MIPLTFINWLLAVLPVLLVLIFMLGLKWGGSKAGAGAWFIAILIAVLRFGAGFELIAFAQIKSVLLALDVLFIIWMALLLFHISNEAGAIQAISKALVSLTADKTMQGLILGWIFVSFLQGMGGFGVPVAVTAPLLVGVGFSPIQAVIMASVGHGWAVNYGSMATSFQTMIAVTNLPGEFLAPETALLLGLSSVVCGWIVAFVAGGWKGLRKTWLMVALIAAIMGTVQYLLATNSLWNLG